MESCVNCCIWYAAPQQRPPRDWLMRMKNGGGEIKQSSLSAGIERCMLLSQAVANCIFRAEGFSLHWQGKPSNENRITPNMKHVESFNPRDLITVQPPSGSKIMKPNFPKPQYFRIHLSKQSKSGRSTTVGCECRPSPVIKSNPCDALFTDCPRMSPPASKGPSGYNSNPTGPRLTHKPNR